MTALNKPAAITDHKFLHHIATEQAFFLLDILKKTATKYYRVLVGV